MSVWNPRMLCEGFIGSVSTCTEGAGNLKVVIGKCIPCKIKMEIGRECRTYFHRFVRDWGHVFGSFVDRKKVKLDDSIHFTFSHDLLSWTPDYFCLKWKPHEPTWFFSYWIMLHHCFIRLVSTCTEASIYNYFVLQRTRLNLISTTSWDAKCLISLSRMDHKLPLKAGTPCVPASEVLLFQSANMVTWLGYLQGHRMGAILLFPTVLAST